MVVHEDLVGRDRGRMAIFQSAPWPGTSISLTTKVGDAVENVVLVGHMVVERHRLDTQLLARCAHGQRLGPALADQLDGGAGRGLPGQGVRRSPVRGAFRAAALLPGPGAV